MKIFLWKKMDKKLIGRMFILAYYSKLVARFTQIKTNSFNQTKVLLSSSSSVLLAEMPTAREEKLKIKKLV